MEIQVLVGDAARKRLLDADFEQAWIDVWSKCAWATVFQSFPFAGIWYEIYQTSATPVLALGFESKRLVGIFPLVIENGELTVAGSVHCEYQVWIALDSYQATFPDAALKAVDKQLHAKLLRLRFVPPGTPLAFLANWRAAVTPVTRGLVNLNDTAKIQETWRKKSNKSRLSRLARHGALTFTRIDDPEEFDRILETTATYCDLRHGAAEGNRPFQDDPRKMSFYRAMARRPELLHTTVLRCGGTLAGVHIGLKEKTSVGLGLIAHSPSLAAHSPGKIQLLMLIQELAKEGYETFDLTPGGEYKDRFSNACDEAAIVTIFFSRSLYWRYKLRASVVKPLSSRLGAAPRRFLTHARQKIQNIALRISRGGLTRAPFQLARALKRFVWHRSELLLYAIDVRNWQPRPEDPSVRRDMVSGLLLFNPAEAWQGSRQDFLRQAAGLLEAGSHCYTIQEEGDLVHYGWLNERQSVSILGGGRPDFELPPNSAVAYDFYTTPKARGRGLYQKSLTSMLNAAAAIPGTEQVFMCVESDNAPSRRVIEKAGFSLVKRVVSVSRFGVRRHFFG